MQERTKILLVEDDKVDQMAFERFVEREGLPYDCVIASSVSAAKKALADVQFDAVLLDYLLGDGTAFDLLEEAGDAATLVITGSGDEEIAVKAMKAGAYDYLLKDVEGNYLTALPVVVENAVRHKRAEEELKQYREHLEELVAERTAELQRANEQLVAEIAERVRAEEALQERQFQLSVLNRMGLALAGTLELERVYGIAFEHVAQLVDCPNFGISLYDPTTRTLRAEFMLDEGELIDAARFPPLDMDIEPTQGRVRAIATRQTEIITDYPAVAEKATGPTVRVGVSKDEHVIGAAMYVPMVARGQVMGLLEVQSYRLDAYGEEEAALLGPVANQIGLAIQNAHLYGAVQQELAERKRAEEELKQALAEKTTLLQELYHRTKNNMQVIYSMLALRSLYVQDEQLLTILEDVQDKIHSMALVHQKLDESRDLSNVDLKEYIDDLTAYLMQSYKVQSNRISLDLDTDGVFVLIDTAIPCGLILSELVSNALKHAFPGDRAGRINIQLHRAEDETITLQISDDGVGVPGDFDFRKSDSLGLQTVLGIVEHQLHGEITVETDHGVAWKIRFIDHLYSPRV